ncbi:hypothetical protein BABINDRAFT_5424 [Babjeviella inositovora NRRL Y-12698]|uniref:Uncharacterized protein n=1 Tax=Babjeviella inositovora NRRL Y-12698 TaxID=984486 RepID=A0A1E3QZF6_9ASCO|nr:uncharacterized protein BABINDRAFT_5424 [Babjeviella inositovora NRRL Y-12698]ODQ82462.1 hypothetical protein BABINDRAFT_5424 [Babjeviella inositovora NRRL Y-12698]
MQFYNHPGIKRHIDETSDGLVRSLDTFARIASKRIRTTKHKLPRRDANANAAAFAPYSREKLLERLKTYNVLNWNIDDEDLSALKCARNGWSCVNNQRNTLSCVSCHLYMAVKLDSYPIDLSTSTVGIFGYGEGEYAMDECEETDQMELRHNLSQQYVRNLKTSHSPACPWAKVECPLHIYHFDYHDMPRIVQDFIQRLRSLARNTETLHEAIQLSGAGVRAVLLSEQLRSLEFMARQHAASDVFCTAPMDDIPRFIYELALLGWDLNIQQFKYKDVLLLSCMKCNRRILLNNTNQGHSHPIDAVQSVPVKPEILLTPTKILAPCDYMPHTIDTNGYFGNMTGPEGEAGDELDIVSEHQLWCSYVASSSESTADTGYQLVYDILKMSQDA